MKKLLSRHIILSILTLSFLFIFQANVSAAESTGTENKKPTVALLFVNNAKSTYDSDITKKMMDNFERQLSEKYTSIAGGPYIERLNKVGISDITTAERADIVEAFKGDDIDYVLYAEVQPFVRKERRTYFTYGIDITAIIPLKIIDLKNNKYLYNGKFTELASDSSMIGGVGNKSVSMKALDSAIVKLNSVIAVRLPSEVSPSESK